MCRWSVTNTIIENHVELRCWFQDGTLLWYTFHNTALKKGQLIYSAGVEKIPAGHKTTELLFTCRNLWIKLHVEKTNVDRSGAYFWWIIHFKTVDTQSNYLDVGAQKSNIPAFFYYVLFLPCINLIGLLRRRLSFYTARHSIFIDAGKLWITMYHYQIYPVESITLDVSKGLEG